MRQSLKNMTCQIYYYYIISSIALKLDNEYQLKKNKINFSNVKESLLG